MKGVHAHSHQGSISESDSPRANEEEEPAASEGLKVEGLKVVKKRRRRCGSSFSATFDFKTLRLSDAAGSSMHLDEFIQAWYRIFGKLNHE